MPSTAKTLAPRSSSESTDAELLARWREGSAIALDQLLRRYQQPLFSLFFRQLGNRSDADDMTQRVFLKILDRLPRLRDDNAFRAWAFKIAVNLKRNRFRALSRFRLTGEDALELQPYQGPNQEELFQLERQRDKLRSLVANLPKNQSQSAQLRLYADLSFREIGEVIGISEASAKVSFHHAVQKIRSAFGELSGENLEETS